MKTNIKIFFAAALAALTVGCTDLDVPVESQYTSYPNSEAALEAQLSGIYFQMRDCFGRRYMEGLALSSDEYTAVSYGGNWYDNGAYAHPSLHSFTYEDASIDWMTVLASGVVKANEVIDSEADDSYKAPARAMRAFFTYIMMDCWGDVAINDSKLSGQIDLEKRQPRADVARWIESELKEIIPQLTTETTGENYGKPNKYMAQALLAKLYINWPVYTAASPEAYDANSYSGEKLAECIAVCDEIIKSGIEVWKPYEVPGAAKTFGNFIAIPFKVPHDGVDCYGFYIKCDGQRLIYATDFEYLPFRFQKQRLNHMIIECNYTQDMLELSDAKTSH